MLNLEIGNIKKTIGLIIHCMYQVDRKYDPMPEKGISYRQFDTVL